jgi:hypothetical protein
MIDDVCKEIQDGNTYFWPYASEGLYKSFETVSMIAYQQNATDIPYLTELRQELIMVDALMSTADPKNKRGTV